MAERVNQAREVSRNTSNRVAEEVIRRVQMPQELPRPVSRRSRRYTQNNNILDSEDHWLLYQNYEKDTILEIFELFRFSHNLL